MPPRTPATCHVPRWALVLILLTVITRLPALLFPRPIDDESIYSVVANEIVDGGRPYIDAIERKPPLLFWTYAGVIGTAGQFNWIPLHAVSVAWILLTMAGLYVIGRNLFDQQTGLIAALLYSVYQPWLTWNNLAFNGELLMNLPLVWGWAILTWRSRSAVRPELLGAGALLAAGFLLKQPAAIAAVPAALYLLQSKYRTDRGLTKAHSFIQATLLTAGFFGTLGVVVVILRAQGILGEALYWTITNHDLPHVFWQRALEVTALFVGLCFPLAWGTAVSLRQTDLWHGLEAERVALAQLLVVSAIGTAASGRFYPHYYIQLIPPLALLAAPYFARILRGTTRPRWFPPRRFWGALAFTALVFFVIDSVGLRYFSHVNEAGRYVRDHSSPDDRLFVWGQQPVIYLDAERRPASRYVTTFPLTGYIFGGPLPGVDTRDRIVPGAWANFARDIERHPPAFIVDTQIGDDDRYPPAQFPVFADMLADRYTLVARTEDGLIYKRK